eukprot:CAMPEP_0115741388 /NCGR_PEP_ID=MMETSP0272-20121206/89976_1 /TAXON_ID=71861 /ORGANISM="Scrippsiella trochoidea, Strain CCMP3099" /LENGTH=95 /DNA_ID=CAMNT_0003186057 /DNA_START=21 /DNA_END=304 /DNA_ORIENTATION=+
MHSYDGESASAAPDPVCLVVRRTFIELVAQPVRSPHSHRRACSAPKSLTQWLPEAHLQCDPRSSEESTRVGAEAGSACGVSPISCGTGSGDDGST